MEFKERLLKFKYFKGTNHFQIYFTLNAKHQSYKKKLVSFVFQQFLRFLPPKRAQTITKLFLSRETLI